MSRPTLHRCSYCRSWLNQRGQRIKLPKWIEPDKCDITDHCCNVCMTEQLVLAQQGNARYRAKLAGTGDI